MSEHRADGLTFGAVPQPGVAQRTPPPSLRRRLLGTAVLVVVEPPLVPRALWPTTIAKQLAARLPAAVDAVLDRLDLTQMIIDHVSVARIVESIDVEQLVGRMDLSAVVSKVLDDVDLPGIIRGSTGSLASESMVGVRVQSASADDAVDRLVARIVPGRRTGNLRDGS